MSSVVDNYEINVAKKKAPDDKYGKHWCRIQLDTFLEKEAEEKLAFLRELFGDNFNVTMIHWVCRGEKKGEWE